METLEINYFRKHIFKEVTEPTLLYINGSHMCFKVYGLNKSYKLNTSRVKVEYDPTQTDIDQFDSFINQTKSESSPDTPTTHKNSDVLGQIEKAYGNQ
jgi:hypothetical protein